MAFFLGFDAGGTKTTCALAHDTHVLARDAGGSIKPLRVSIEHAGQNLAALLGEIVKQSGVDLGNISASCIGTAGVRLPQTDGWMRQILSQYASGEIVVCGDEEIALDAAFPGGAGVLAMAGTGSNVMGRTSQGEMLNVGGWGPALGDQTSGHWIGHQALRLACRARDFGQPTQILDRVIEYWSAETIEEVVNIGNRTPPPDFLSSPLSLSNVLSKVTQLRCRFSNSAAVCLAKIQSKLSATFATSIPMPRFPASRSPAASSKRSASYARA